MQGWVKSLLVRGIGALIASGYLNNKKSFKLLVSDHWVIKVFYKRTFVPLLLSFNSLC